MSLNLTVPKIGKVPIMTVGRPPRIALILAATSLLSGCAEEGPFLAHRATLGSLKTSVSHLGFENEQLRRQVADLKAENRQIEDRLVQEEAVNGDLAARLDDARNALRGRGDDWDDLPRTADPESRKTLPAGRSNKKRRKPPFVQIPGQVDTMPPSDSRSRGPRDRLDDPKVPREDDPGPQSWLEGNNRWLPIARGSSLPSVDVR